jgi:hypothetical protein
MSTEESTQRKSLRERFEIARTLLGENTVKTAQEAIAELTPALGRTTSISEFQTLADLLSRAYIITRDLPLARQWLQYAPSKPGRADIRVLAEVVLECGDLEASAAHYREYVRQFE